MIAVHFNKEEKCDIMLRWWQNFSITTIWNLSNDDGDHNKNVARITLFLYDIYQPSLQDCEWNFVISRPRLMELVNTK